MDAFFFHPKLVHLPIALGLLMPLVAGGLLVAWWRERLPRQAWLAAVALQAILLGSGVLALRSGEVEEDRVERVVAERFIAEHEAAAERFVWASAGVLALMLPPVALRRRRLAISLAAAATVGTLVVLGLGYRTGQAGGSLVYAHGAGQAYAAGPQNSPGAGLILPANDDEAE